MVAVFATHNAYSMNAGKRLFQSAAAYRYKPRIMIGGATAGAFGYWKWKQSSKGHYPYNLHKNEIEEISDKKIAISFQDGGSPTFKHLFAWNQSDYPEKYHDQFQAYDVEEMADDFVQKRCRYIP